MLEALERKKKEKELEQLREKEGIDYEGKSTKALVFEDQKLKKQQEEKKAEYDGVHLEAATILKDGRKYYKEMKKFLEASDVILIVLDARDPESCRCRKIEAEVKAMSGDKKIILVLNKINLVSSINAEAW